MFAIFRRDGKQYRVSTGDTIRLDRIKSEPGGVFEIDEVLAISLKKGELVLGDPLLKDTKIVGKILSHGKDKKVIVFKRKRRKTYRRKYGHRQPHTLLKIEKIASNLEPAKNKKSENKVPKKDVTKKQSKNVAPLSTSENKLTKKNIDQ